MASVLLLRGTDRAASDLTVVVPVRVVGAVDVTGVSRRAAMGEACVAGLDDARRMVNAEPW